MDSAAAPAGQNATTSLGIMPGPALDALREVLRARRPWDEDTIARRLRTWAATYWTEDALSPGDADGAAEVASQLRVLGRATDFDDETAVRVTFHMLRNVAHGRGPTTSDLVGETIRGLPARSMRRYRAEPDGFARVIRRTQRALDIGALMGANRSEVAARRWLLRHPSKHAKDAPAARRGRV